MWFINFFHIQILLIELLFCLRLQKKSFFWLRFIPCATIFIALPEIVPGGFYSPFLMLGGFTLSFFVMFILSGLLIWFCFEMNIRQVIFYCCVAHTLQHMIHCLYRISDIALPYSFEVIQILQIIYTIATCIIVYQLLWYRFRGSETVDFQNNYLLTFALVSTLIIYVVSYITVSKEGETIGVHIFDFFSCFLLVVILLDIFRIRKAEREQMIMERILRQEQEQHSISRDTMDVIDRKCHDLRHQINALRLMDDEEKEKSIQELEKAVMIYDSFPKTGNRDLDIILADKGLLAEKQNISIRCIVDGNALSFMALEDMYSLIGNALDNAIEATSKVEMEGKRIVTLHLAAKNSLVSLHLENPCIKRPLFINGIPITNKADKDYHGYGIRSMHYICEKYGGAMTTGWEDGFFLLDILFSIESE